MEYKIPFLGVGSIRPSPFNIKIGPHWFSYGDNVQSWIDTYIYSNSNQLDIQRINNLFIVLVFVSKIDKIMPMWMKVGIG